MPLVKNLNTVSKGRQEDQMGVEEILKAKQEEERRKAAESAVKEVEITLPKGIDISRLAEISQNLSGGKVLSTDPSPQVTEMKLGPKSFPHKEERKIKNEDVPALGTAQFLPVLILSVTDKPFIPVKRPTAGEKPEFVKKYEVLIEVNQPLQVGKEYQIIV